MLTFVFASLPVTHFGNALQCISHEIYVQVIECQRVEGRFTLQLLVWGYETAREREYMCVTERKRQTEQASERRLCALT